VERVGWSWFFGVSALLAIPGMLLLTFFVLSGRFERGPDAAADSPGSG
jgi:hypothetical protein